MGLISGSGENPPPANAIIGAEYYTGKGAAIDVVPGARGFFRGLAECLAKTQVTGPTREDRVPVEKALDSLSDEVRAIHEAGGKTIFIGNGGSAAIASHMAVDYAKNKGVRAIAFNDAAMLTCLANDYGYAQVFAAQLGYYALEEDAVVIISSSGRSENILAAADRARSLRCRYMVTLSGMNPNNALRMRGDLNFYVPCVNYGLVELTHLALLHSVASV